GARRERDVAGRLLLTLTDDVLHLLAHGVERDAERLERLGGDALALVDQAEQDVLGADVVVVEHLRLFLGEDHHSSGAVREAFEHVSVLRAMNRMFHVPWDTRTTSYPRGAPGAAPDERSRRLLRVSIAATPDKP